MITKRNRKFTLIDDKRLRISTSNVVYNQSEIAGFSQVYILIASRNGYIAQIIDSQLLSNDRFLIGVFISFGVMELDTYHLISSKEVSHQLLKKSKITETKKKTA